MFFGGTGFIYLFYYLSYKISGPIRETRAAEGVL